MSRSAFQLLPSQPSPLPPMWERPARAARYDISAARIAVHASGQFDVEPGEAADIMRRKPDVDGLVDIRPFGVMIEFFRSERGPSHESEGLAEVAEGEAALDGQAVFGDRPAFQSVERFVHGLPVPFIPCHAA